MPFTYYELLGLEQDASDVQIMEATKQMLSMWDTIEAYSPPEHQKELSDLKERCGHAIGTLFSQNSRKEYNQQLETHLPAEVEKVDNLLKAQWSLCVF